MQEPEELQSFTVEEFRTYFDELIERVENGESFIIKSDYGNAVIVPYKESISIFEDFNMDDELIRLHTEHEEGS